MKKIKSQKGITLLALIITIVVLLILAVVAIGAVRDSKIIAHAQNAGTTYEEAKNNETTILGQYETLLDEQQGIGPWSLDKDGETVKNSKTGEKKKIGEEIANDVVLSATGGTKSTYTGTWTILGVENGRLKLVTTTDVTTNYVILGKEDSNAPTDLKEILDREGEETNLNLEKAIWSYQHAVETLDGHAKTATGITSARSIKIEDLEVKEVLNITDEKKVKLCSNYGKTFNYFFDIETLKVTGRQKTIIENEILWFGVTTSSYASQVFVDKDGKIVLVDSENDEVTLNHTHYINKNDFTDEQKTKYANSLAKGEYWLASSHVESAYNIANFGLYRVNNGSILASPFFASYGLANGNNISRVRAVVYI